MSDSHGSKKEIEQAVGQTGKVDLWLHAGDFCSDSDYLAICSGAKVISVAGNCDGLAAKAPVDEFVEIAGKKIWLTHGHKYQVKYGTDELIDLARQYEVDVVIYGHTHIVDICRIDNLLVLNPGSIGRPYGQNPSFLIMNIETGNIDITLMEIR